MALITHRSWSLSWSPCHAHGSHHSSLMIFLLGSWFLSLSFPAMLTISLLSIIPCPKSSKKVSIASLVLSTIASAVDIFYHWSYSNGDYRKSDPIYVEGGWAVVRPFHPIVLHSITFDRALASFLIFLIKKDSWGYFWCMKHSLTFVFLKLSLIAA